MEALTISDPITSVAGMQFRPVTAADMPRVMPYLKMAPGRTTDYTYLGLLMWAPRFDYTYCIYRDTLFIKGRLEDDRRCVAFSLPLGAMPLEESIDVLRRYCRAHRLPLRLSAIPDEAMPELMALHPDSVTPLPHWADYLYSAEALATLSGKKLSKKRNHVNRFRTDHEGRYELEPLTARHIPALLAFMDEIEPEAHHSESAESERILTRSILADFDAISPYTEGAVLIADGRVVAFTIADIKGDTLYIHIEKADHGVAGASETINQAFAAMMLAKHPDLHYINREDDAGDPGLQRAKTSYHPLALLTKHNLTL